MIGITTSIQEDLDALIPLYTHVAFFTNYDACANTDVLASKLELGRIAIIPVRTGNKLTIDFTMNTTIYCPSTTISAVTSTTVFTLTSISGFAIGDRIIIRDVGGIVERKISNISGSIVTISSALSVAPTVGTTVNVKISQRAIIKNGTLSALTGTLAFIEDWSFYKDSTMETIGQIIINWTGA